MKEARPLTEEEEVNRWYDGTEKVYRAKVTGRHAITLPADLCRELEIDAGDVVEFRLKYGGVTMRRVRGAAEPESSNHPRVPIDPIGVLAGYFESMDDVNRYIREGRGTWTEADEAEYQKNCRLERAAMSGD